MFGTLRLILSMLVVMNHVPNNGFPFDVAVSAVILFYLITGHLMGLKFEEYRRRCARPGRLFLADRFLRIYPPYLVVLLLTMLLVAGFGPSRSLPVHLDVPSVMGNLFLLPVNYFMFLGDFSLFIPQAFSLALEEQFYLLLPLLLTFRALIPLAIGSGLLVVLGVAALGLTPLGLTKLTGDYLIYRLLPGTFGLFLLGVGIRREPIAASRVNQIILGAYGALFLAAYLGDVIQQWQVLAVALGVLAGYPIVSYLARLPRNRFDEMMGRGAYGTFLIHFTVIWAMQRFVFPQGVTHPGLFKALIVGLSVAGGFLLHFLVERPMHRLRHRYIERYILRHPALAP